MRTANPALSNTAYLRYNKADIAKSGSMTIQGTVNKTVLSLLVLMLSAFWVWNNFFAAQSAEAVSPWMMLGVIGGLILALITIFKRTWAPYTVPAYALFEGLFIGGISAIFELQYPGIVLQAVGLTFGTLFALLAAYKSGMIKVTEKFRLGVIAATGGIALVYLASFVFSIFGVNMGFIYGSGLSGILFSVFVVAIAALNLVLDFDFIEQASEQGAPKYMEWYGAFGLMVTLIWLYIEILRLLAKSRSRR